MDPQLTWHVRDRETCVVTHFGFWNTWRQLNFAAQLKVHTPVAHNPLDMNMQSKQSTEGSFLFLGTFFISYPENLFLILLPTSFSFVMSLFLCRRPLFSFLISFSSILSVRSYWLKFFLSMLVSSFVFLFPFIFICFSLYFSASISSSFPSLSLAHYFFFPNAFTFFSIHLSFLSVSLYLYFLFFHSFCLSSYLLPFSLLSSPALSFLPSYSPFSHYFFSLCFSFHLFFALIHYFFKTMKWEDRKTVISRIMYIYLCFI